MDGLEKDIRSGQFVPPEWLARVPGVLTHRKQHLHTVFHFGLRLWEEGKEMCDRVKSITALFFPLCISCFCLSGCCFEVFPWEQWSRAGRCCCPWCRNSQTWWGHNVRRFFFFFFVISASAAYEHCQAVIIYGCCVALIQNDKFRLRRHTETRHIAAGLDRVSLLLLCPRAFCLNQRWAN